MNKILKKEMLSSFNEYLICTEKSRATIEKYMRDIKNFYTYVGKTPITKAVILEYKEYLKEKYAYTSSNSILSTLNTFFKFMNWEDCLVKHFKIQHNTYCSQETVLTKTEYKRLVEVAEKNNIKISLIIQTICSTGMRVSELHNITVESVKKGEAIVSSKGKTRKIFIVSALRRKLERYIEKNSISDGPVFLNKGGKPIDRSTIWREMKKLAKDANILQDKVYPHNLRHLFARTFYEKDNDIAKLADVLGHSSINTTRIYIISTGVEHKKCMEKLDLII